MKHLLIASTALTLICGASFAQGAAGPAQQNNMNKPSLTSGKTEMGPIQVASNSKTGMKKKKHHGKKGGMAPDASGQGGSGPGSDQGGTKVAPGNMK